MNHSINPGRAVVVGEDGGLVVRGDRSLSNREELIRPSLGIPQGRPVSVRSILENDIMTINLSSHEGRRLGRLH